MKMKYFYTKTKTNPQAWDDAALNITVNPLEVSLLIACFAGRKM